jgi:hypothetical protein
VGQQIAKLVERCITSQNEIVRLSAIALASLAPSKTREILGVEIPKERQAELREEGKRFGGIDTVLRKYREGLEEYRKNLSELAEFLEEGGGSLINKFRNDLGADQFSWLESHIGDIKKHLKGIEII